MTIFNPPLLIRQNTDRPMEAVSFKVIQLVDKIGIFRSQKPLPTEVLAQAMINSAKTKDSGVLKLEGKAIWECAEVNYK
ncbi:hypothetical protein V5E38_07615 [Rossellomorea sp. GAMAL-10_SWC]